MCCFFRFFRFWLLALSLILLLLMVAATPGQTAPPAETQVPDTVLLLVPVLAGSIGIPLINRMKKTLGWVTDADKIKNIWLD